MARRNIFADESGNFDFSRKPGASKYFILTTVTMGSYAAGDALLQLRRDMAWDGLGLISEFHATTDAQAVRDRVFEALRAHDFRIDATHPGEIESAATDSGHGRAVLQDCLVPPPQARGTSRGACM